MQTVYLIATRLREVLQSGEMQDWQMYCVTKKDKIKNFESWNQSNTIEVKIFAIELPLNEEQ